MIGLSKGGDAGGHALSLPATTGDEEFIVLLAQTGIDTDSNQINIKHVKLILRSWREVKTGVAIQAGCRDSTRASHPLQLYSFTDCGSQQKY